MRVVLAQVERVAAHGEVHGHLAREELCQQLGAQAPLQLTQPQKLPVALLEAPQVHHGRGLQRPGPPGAREPAGARDLPGQEAVRGHQQRPHDVLGPAGEGVVHGHVAGGKAVVREALERQEQLGTPQPLLAELRQEVGHARDHGPRVWHLRPVRDPGGQRGVEDLVELEAVRDGVLGDHRGRQQRSLGLHVADEADRALPGRAVRGRWHRELQGGGGDRPVVALRIAEHLEPVGGHHRTRGQGRAGVAALAVHGVEVRDVGEAVREVPPVAELVRERDVVRAPALHGQGEDGVEGAARQRRRLQAASRRGKAQGSKVDLREAHGVRRVLEGEDGIGDPEAESVLHPRGQHVRGHDKVPRANRRLDVRRVVEVEQACVHGNVPELRNVVRRV
mmetsp:Transcript_104569/g.295495  ORF Transcript_104569/g.295495 Transcript_104569/m.295495 type:complete len:392 (-) Transcript_104569:3323-4498(-)